MKHRNELDGLESRSGDVKFLRKLGLSINHRVPLPNALTRQVSYLSKQVANLTGAVHQTTAAWAALSFGAARAAFGVHR
jgi:hypothetical protein